MSDFKIGDVVERIMDFDETVARQDRDWIKREKLGMKPGHFFTGNAAAYLHEDEGYVILAFTETGGLRLRGFSLTVSPKDVRLSTQPTYR